MLKIFLTLFVVSISVVQADTKLSVMGSVTYNSPDNDRVDQVGEEVSKLGLGAGMRALMGIKDQFHFRSGAGLVSKNVGYDVAGDDYELSFVYLNIPLTLYWQASEQVGFFGGTAINAKLSDDCEVDSGNGNCTIDGDETLVFPAVLGFDFSFNEKMGMEVSYEYGLTDTSKHLKIHSAVASFLYHFDK